MRSSVQERSWRPSANPRGPSRFYPPLYAVATSVATIRRLLPLSGDGFTLKLVEATTGIEPVYAVLQSPAERAP